MTTKRLKSLTAAGAARRLGIDPGTFRHYLKNARKARAAGRDEPGLVPEPDVDVDDKPTLWTPEAIDEWNARRPGAGRRTDIAHARAAGESVAWNRRSRREA